jgi:hypothetical protein
MHLQAAFAQRAGGFHADETGTDQRHRCRVAHGRDDRARIRQRAQRMHVVAVEAGCRQAHGSAPWR